MLDFNLFLNMPETIHQRPTTISQYKSYMYTFYGDFLPRKGFVCLTVMKVVVQKAILCTIWQVFLHLQIMLLLLLWLLLLLSLSRKFWDSMTELDFIQSMRRINYHDDIILRHPTLSNGERLLTVCFKNQTNNSSILEFEYPNCEKNLQEIMRDLLWKAERTILAIQTVKSLN